MTGQLVALHKYALSTTLKLWSWNLFCMEIEIENGQKRIANSFVYILVACLMPFGDSYQYKSMLFNVRLAGALHLGRERRHAACRDRDAAESCACQGREVCWYQREVSWIG